MLVTPDTFTSVLARLKHKHIALDTETTGLAPFQGDKLFAIILADDEESYYFNFQEYKDYPQIATLPREWLPRFTEILSDPSTWLYAHNAVFDLHFLELEGINNYRQIWCTAAMARLEYNQHLKYGLSECATRIGEQKLDTVMKYMDEHSLYTVAKTSEGKAAKQYFFHRVPPSIIIPYGEQDARSCYALGVHQMNFFTERAYTHMGEENPKRVVHNESRLTPVLVRMQKEGIGIDLPYCQKALEYEKSRSEGAKDNFALITGNPLVDSAKHLEPILVAHGVKLGVTPKGSASVDYASLAPFSQNPVVECVLTYRDSLKRLSTYWANFLRYGSTGRIHTWLNQFGAATGRFSSSRPNLQNIPKSSDTENTLYPVRKAFVPDPGGFFLSIDYRQMEYRLMLDYAGEHELIERIRSGLDVHQATADLAGITRTEAKTLNFLLLYGGGTVKTCLALFPVTIGEVALWAVYKEWKKLSPQKWEPMERKAIREIDFATKRAHIEMLLKTEELRAKYFSGLPRVKRFIENVVDTAKRRQYVFNWLGRYCYFPNTQFAYAAPNHLIQGGCADIIKSAMVLIDGHLRSNGLGTKMLINIHDELLFWCPWSEQKIGLELSDIMKNVYQSKHLPLDCSISWSASSWGELKKGLPDGEETRDIIQGEGATRSGGYA